MKYAVMMSNQQNQAHVLLGLGLASLFCVGPMVGVPVWVVSSRRLENASGTEKTMLVIARVAGGASVFVWTCLGGMWLRHNGMI
jgi:hypothetical protein